MRLTNSHRQAFVIAAMQDVPSIDYRDQIQSLVQKDLADQLPPDVRKVWDNAQTKQYIKVGNGCFGPFGQQVGVAGPSHDKYSLPELTNPTQAKLKELTAAFEIQIKHHKELSNKLKAAAYAVTTRKALAELLPEFDKYLPADVPLMSKNLPAVANLMSDFVKAGWPKQNKRINPIKPYQAATP